MHAGYPFVQSIDDAILEMFVKAWEGIIERLAESNVNCLRQQHWKTLPATITQSDISTRTQSLTY